jgi:2'-5' RNA ligase
VAATAVAHRRYRAHVTIARARREPADLRHVVDAAGNYAGTPWAAVEIVLVRS